MKPMIVVECGNDEQLMKLLGLPKKRIQHEGNRDEVVKYVLKKDPGGCIGVIDQDPGTPRGAQRSQFKPLKAASDLHLELAGERRLLVLHPMLEGWLIKAVHDCGGSMAKLDKGLSDDARTLHKQLAPKGDPRMAKIVEFLKKKDSKHLNELRVQLGLG
ncbi:MAG: hypothetical protein IPL64_00045 [Flavobacteriales bacterium]|jgi:hypothetical protein|nr:hypothetical protein [Flavobacteriales bacterium]MBK8707168.1 hypothetical protein [Flavobacteriales bacterium]